MTWPTYWLFKNNRQVGTVSWDNTCAMPWRANRLWRGVPSAQRHFVQLSDALAFATETVVEKR